MVQFLTGNDTSAGSIVAALVAAGYKADEIYCPGTTVTTGVFNKDFHDFFDETEWKLLKSMRENVSAYFDSRKHWPLPLKLIRLYLENRQHMQLIKKRGGILGTEKFRSWMNDQLCAKLTTIRDREACFKDLSMPLKIIACDVKQQSMRVFSMPHDADIAIADAVCASISIPFVFQPFDMRFVDGGIVSNFPAWVFDEERKKSPPLTPTFGFRLIQSGISERSTEFDLISYACDVACVAVFGDNTLERRQISTLHEVPLRVSVGPIDFEIDQAARDNLYRQGKEGARDYFASASTFWRTNDSEVSIRLLAIEKVIRQSLSHQGHLRLNVMLPISNHELQIIYSLNMDSNEDCDDRLRFKKGAGGCGACWQKLDYAVCNLQIAARNYSKWNLDKYTQAMIRKSLCSLVSIPIYNPKRLGDESLAARNDAFIGVLSVDSDEDLLDGFRAFIQTRDAKLCSRLLADVLTNLG